jgi:hypothetical protein
MTAEPYKGIPNGMIFRSHVVGKRRVTQLFDGRSDRIVTSSVQVLGIDASNLAGTTGGRPGISRQVGPVDRATASIHDETRGTRRGFSQQ